MTVVCPTITAYTEESYAKQMTNVQDFANRIHIDVMDDVLTPTPSIPLADVRWPENLIADIHLMYKEPMAELDLLVKLKPHMVLIHAEADVEHEHFAAHLKDNGIKAGLVILQQTPVEQVTKLIPYFDQVLVFAGHLGFQDGHADMSMLDKVRHLRELYPELEIAWDGGINEVNAKQIVEAGVDVLNVGGFIQHSQMPKDAYDKLLSSLS